MVVVALMQQRRLHLGRTKDVIAQVSQEDPRESVEGLNWIS